MGKREPAEASKGKQVVGAIGVSEVKKRGGRHAATNALKQVSDS